jgi:hypothetical protein
VPEIVRQELQLNIGQATGFPEYISKELRKDRTMGAGFVSPHSHVLGLVSLKFIRHLTMTFKVDAKTGNANLFQFTQPQNNI